MKATTQATANCRECWWLPTTWVLAGFLFSLQAWLGEPMAEGRALKIGLAEWGPWLLIAPAAVWLVFRFPLTGSAWPRALAIHLVACAAALTMLNAVANAALPRRPEPPPWQKSAAGPVEERSLPPRWPTRPWLMQLRQTVPLYWLLVTIAHLIHHRRQADLRKRQAEAELAEARLEALQLQLRPHFLFNCLNGILALIPAEPARAEQMLLALSRLLHAALATGGRREVPLSEELEIAEAYLLIQQIRFGANLQIDRTISPGLANASVPPLLLQPILENAVVHGLAGRTGTIRLTAARQNDRLLLRITNISSAPPTNRVTRGRGIGLHNTHQRLRTLYGPDHRFELRSEPSATSAEIEIPWRETTWSSR